MQTNVSFSRKGVIRGLHYHERGQDDLFACLTGMARVVVLDRETDETFTVDIGEENPVAVYVPGRHAHGFEALTDLLFCYHVTREYDPADPDEHGIPWDDPRVRHLWSTDSPILSERDRVLITGRGRPARRRAGRGVPGGGRADAGGARRDGADRARLRARLVLHAAAWTDVDGAEADEAGRAPGERRGDAERLRRWARRSSTTPPTTSSTGRSGSRTSSRTSRRRSAPTGAPSSSASARFADGWIVRSSWLFGWTGHNFVRTMLRLGAERDEVRVVADQRGCPTYVGHLAAATRELLGLPGGVWHLAAEGEATWAELAEAIFEEAGLDCRVVPISTEELGQAGPAAGVLGPRSEREGAPSSRTGARASGVACVSAWPALAA